MASGGTMYRWYDAAMNGNLLFEGPAFIASVTSTTEFYVANVVGNIESKRTRVVVQVHPQPVLTCNFPDTGLQFEAVTFSAAVSSGTSPFTWTFDMGDEVVVTSSKPELIYAYKESGEFTVRVAVSDANGCTAECADEIVVRAEDLFIPNVITANDDTENDLFTVFSISDDGSTVYEGTRSFSMFIYNRWGEQIYYSEKPADGWKGVDHASGVYFYHIVLGDSRYRGTVSVMK
jgi:PKD repeat protein